MTELLKAKLPPEVRQWVCHATVALVLSDRVIADEERETLLEVREILQPSELSELIERVRGGELRLGRLHTSRDIACRVLMYLTEVAVRDGEFAAREQAFLKEAGENLGLEASLASKAIDWGLTLLKERAARDALFVAIRREDGPRAQDSEPG